MSQNSGIRLASAAGAFYPAAPSRLSEQVNALLAAGSSAGDCIRALIVPHAGYAYSGRTAGKAYALLGGADWVHRAVILAPSHTCAFRGLALPKADAFRIPLGDIPVDRPCCDTLAAQHSLFRTDDAVFDDEHAIEVQLPFLHAVLPHARIVPVLCGDLDRDESAAATAALAAAVPHHDTLWIVSTDFTHFGAAFGFAPFSEDIPARLAELDFGAVDHILKGDGEGFSRYVASTGATICGAAALGVFLGLAHKLGPGWRGRLVDYTTSAHGEANPEHSVSYASIAFSEPTVAAGPETGPLTRSEQQALLALARSALHDAVAGDGAPAEMPELTAHLNTPGACFVTLRLGDDLRGCIGSCTPTQPLYLDVMDNTRKAARQDPRFAPVTSAELPRMRIEISVLGAVHPIFSPADFKVGRHGIILHKAGRQSVYLPSVPVEQGWDARTTLDRLSRKAGLPPSAWQQGARLEVFEAVTFEGPAQAL